MGGASALGPRLARIAEAADAAGFWSLSVPDHLIQLASMGGATSDMLEAYTTLGFLAARTTRLQLMALVSPPNFRYPAVLAKSVTTLDVLSGGRAWLGLGAGSSSDDAESTALGLPCPPLSRRYADLEVTIRTCFDLWSGTTATPFVPAPLRRPPILIAGDGEQRTLRLVARYADACGLRPDLDVRHKLEVLRRHCETERRDYAAIRKTANLTFDVGPDGSRTKDLIVKLRELADAGVDTVLGREVAHVETLIPIAAIGRDVIPEVSAWN